MAISNYMKRNFNKQRERDSLTTKQRSELMAKIKSKGTKFEEIFIFEFIKIFKTKFEVNVKEIRGKPDIVFKKSRLCIFLDSDFWHGWQYPRWKHLLKNDFWRKKIENNRRRDRCTTAYLKRHNWIVIRIWEHNMKSDMNKCIKEIKNNLKQYRS